MALSATDPLNLTGILLGDERIAATPNHRVVFRDGVPVAALEGRDVRYLGGADVDPEVERVVRRVPDTPRLLSRVR